MDKTALILLAAGAATRMGSPKQLAPFRGQPLVRHTAGAALTSACRPVLVVVGASGREVGAALHRLPLCVVDNPDWAEGVGTSIRAGIQALTTEDDVDSVILMLADQPLITGTFLNQLIATHRRTGRDIVAATYAGTVGVPVLFSRAFFPKLAALTGNQGCKGVILGHPDQALTLPCPEAEADIDTPADLERLGGPCRPGS